MPIITANVECHASFKFPNGSPQKFSYDFEERGNFTFSWDNAILNRFGWSLFCSPQFFILKELVKRTKYLAIPVWVDSQRNLMLPQFNESADAFIDYIYSNELDIYLSRVPLTQMVTSFAKTPKATIDLLSLISIVGSKYNVALYKNQISMYFPKTFDTHFWILFFAVVFLVPLYSSLILFTKRKLKGWRKYKSIVYQETWRVFEGLSSFSSHTKFKYSLYRLIYGTLYFTSFVIIYANLSVLLFQTLIPKYSTIDSLQQLCKTSNVKPILSFTKLDVSAIKKLGTDLEKSVIELLNNVDPGDDLPGDPSGLLRFLKTIKHKVLIKKSHVLLSTQINALLLTLDKRFIFGKNSYIKYPVGFVYNKNLDEDVSKHYNQINFDIQEFGFYKKWVKSILDVAHKRYSGELHYEEFHDDPDSTRTPEPLSLSRLKLSMGPFICGIFLSSSSFIIEVLTHYKF